MIKRCKRCEKLFDGSARQIYCNNCAKMNRAVKERVSRVSEQRAVVYKTLSEEPSVDVCRGRMTEEQKQCMLEKQRKFREARLKNHAVRRADETEV